MQHQSGASNNTASRVQLKREVRWVIAPQHEPGRRHTQGSWLRALPLSSTKVESDAGASVGAAGKSDDGLMGNSVNTACEILAEEIAYENSLLLAENSRYDRTLVNARWQCRRLDPHGEYVDATNYEITARPIVSEGYCAGALPIERQQVGRSNHVSGGSGRAVPSNNRFASRATTALKSSSATSTAQVLTAARLRTTTGGPTPGGGRSAMESPFSPVTPRGAGGGASGMITVACVDSAQSPYSEHSSGRPTTMSSGHHSQRHPDRNEQSVRKNEQKQWAREKAKLLLQIGHDDAHDGETAQWPNTISIDAEHGNGGGICEGKGDGWGRHSWHLAALGVVSNTLFVLLMYWYDTIVH